MSERRDGGELRGKIAAEVARLREQGAPTRGRHADEPPLGGWHPILDDEGRVYGEPPPSEPTDAPEPPAP